MITLTKTRTQVLKECSEYVLSKHNQDKFYWEDQEWFDALAKSAYSIDWPQAQAKLPKFAKPDHCLDHMKHSDAYISHLTTQGLHDPADWRSADDLWRYYCWTGHTRQGNKQDKINRRMWKETFPDYHDNIVTIRWMEGLISQMQGTKPQVWSTMAEDLATEFRQEA